MSFLNFNYKLFVILIYRDFGAWNRMQFVLLVFIHSLLAIIQLSMFLSSWLYKTIINLQNMSSATTKLLLRDHLPTFSNLKLD